MRSVYFSTCPFDVTVRPRNAVVAVIIQLKNAGGAPVLEEQKQVFKIDEEKPLSLVAAQVRKELGLQKDSSLVRCVLGSVFKVEV